MNNASSNDKLQRVLDGNDQTDALLAGGWVRVLTVENKSLAMLQLMIHQGHPMEYFGKISVQMEGGLKISKCFSQRFSLDFSNFFGKP